MTVWKWEYLGTAMIHVDELSDLDKNIVVLERKLEDEMLYECDNEHVVDNDRLGDTYGPSISDDSEVATSDNGSVFFFSFYMGIH